MEEVNKIAEPEVKRGRGRPKKNQMGNNYEKKKKNNDNQQFSHVHIKEASLTKTKDEIILHFPLISLNDITYQNNKDENFPKPVKEKKNDPHDIFTINDGNNSSTKSDSDYNDNNEANNFAVVELRQQVTDLKQTVATLNKEIDTYKKLLNKYDLANRNVNKIDVLLTNATFDCIIPETTANACWWCSHTFDDVQCVLPENVYNDMWYVSGCYCCVECAAADSFDRNDSNVWNRYSLLKQLYKLNNILPTPNKKVFTKFGGPIIYETFKMKSYKCDRTYRLIMPPMASVVPLVEESVIDSTRVSISLNDLKRNAKIKRSKPLPGVKENLFSFG